MRTHAELNFHIAAMGGGKSLQLLVAHHQLDRKVPALIVKPASDLKAGDEVETRLGGTRKQVDFLISKETDIATLLEEKLVTLRRRIGKVAAERTPYVFVDEGQFLLPDHVSQMRDLADDDVANFEVYGLATDFRADFFPGSEALLKWADHIETLNPADVEFMCAVVDCTRTALRNARLVNGQVTVTGSQIAIDGIDASYEALCSNHYRKSLNLQQTDAPIHDTI